MTIGAKTQLQQTKQQQASFGNTNNLPHNHKQQRGKPQVSETHHIAWVSLAFFPGFIATGSISHRISGLSCKFRQRTVGALYPVAITWRCQGKCIIVIMLQLQMLNSCNVIKTFSYGNFMIIEPGVESWLIPIIYNGIDDITMHWKHKNRLEKSVKYSKYILKTQESLR